MAFCLRLTKYTLFPNISPCFLQRSAGATFTAGVRHLDECITKGVQPSVVAVGKLDGGSEEGRVGAGFQINKDIAGDGIEKAIQVLSERHIDMQHEAEKGL